MECRICKVTKLPNEFAPENVTEECEHPNLFCLRCIVKTVKEKSICPYQGCGQKVKLTDKKIRWFQAILDDMFKEYDAGGHEEVDRPSVPNPLFAEGIITISVLTGESMAVPYDPNLEVLQLKREISQTMNHPVDKQKLLYMDGELTSYKDGMPARLLDYSVKPNATLCLVIILFSVPDNFDNVVFDLYWGYPLDGQDFLDASCLMFKGIHCQSICDYSKRNPVHAIWHSGDVMDSVRKIGHHTINVSLKNLPTDVTHLFFTLSAWRSPNISRYPNPSLKFREVSNPTKDLCKTTFHHAGASQAVVMCSVSRGSHGRWEIFESGKLSAGNARNYKPLQTTIQSLIAQGF